MATPHFVSGKAGADHQPHCIPADDEVCRLRVRQRNVARSAGLFYGHVTDEQVDQANNYFTPPRSDEDFIVMIPGVNIVTSINSQNYRR
jgi:hypothetical protein